MDKYEERLDEHGTIAFPKSLGKPWHLGKVHKLSDYGVSYETIWTSEVELIYYDKLNNDHKCKQRLMDD